jgi:uncharacterized membrane protein
MRQTTNGTMMFTSSLIAGVAMTAGFAMHGQTANFNQDPQARHYAITDLGIVGGPPGQPFHVTNNGLVSGSSAETVKGVPTEQAWLWFREFKLFIGTPGLGGKNSVPYSVNQWGQAVGEADTAVIDPAGEDFCGFSYMGYSSGTTCVPMAWLNGVMRVLPLLKDKMGQAGNNGAANAINNWGTVAGVSENTTQDTTCPAYDPSLGQSQKFEQKPVFWQNGRVHEMPTVGGDPDGTVLAINDSGHLAGTTGGCTAFNVATFVSVLPVHAVLWKNGKAIDLGSLGGVIGGIALGMNNRDDVVGGSDLSGDTATHAFLWTKESGKMHDLPPVGDDFFSTAIAVNDERTVTGVSMGANDLRAVVWENGEPTDLNTVISGAPGIYLLIACGVNANGQIIGLAVDGDGNYHGYLATPNWRGWEMAAPIRLPDSVREQVRRQIGIGRFGSRAGAQ